MPPNGNIAMRLLLLLALHSLYVASARRNSRYLFADGELDLKGFLTPPDDDDDDNNTTNPVEPFDPCPLSEDLELIICNDLKDNFEGILCDCDIEASVCGVEGSFECGTTAFAPVQVDSELEFYNTTGNLTLSSEFTVNILDNEIGLKTISDMVFDIPSNVTNTDEYTVSSCEITVRILTSLGFVIDVLVSAFVGDLADCTCDVTGQVAPLPTVSAKCGFLNFEVP